MYYKSKLEICMYIGAIVFLLFVFVLVGVSLPLLANKGQVTITIPSTSKVLWISAIVALLPLLSVFTYQKLSNNVPVATSYQESPMGGVMSTPEQVAKMQSLADKGELPPDVLAKIKQKVADGKIPPEMLQMLEQKEAMAKSGGNMMPLATPTAPIMDLSALASGLAKKVDANPKDLQGSLLLARTYVEIKNYKLAVPRFEKAYKLVEKDSTLLADYANSLVMVSGGKYTKNIKVLLERSLALNVSNVKSLLLLATYGYENKDYKLAKSNWDKVLLVKTATPEQLKEATSGIKDLEGIQKKK